MFVTLSGTTPNGLTVQYNVFDGNKQKTTQGSDSAGGLVRLGSKGTTLFQYNLVRNAWYQEVTCGPTPSVSPFNMTFQYNAFQNSGYGASSGDHGDILQAFSSSVGSPTFNDVEFNWNLILQNELAANAATQGISTGGSAGNTAIYLNENMANNTVVVVPAAGNINYPFIINSDEVNGNSNLANNYVDLTGCHINAGSAVGAYYSDSGTGGGPFHGTVTTSNNINMVTGSVL